MLKKVINIIQLCVMLVVGLVMTLGMMAVPLGLLYMLIAPFFGPNPSTKNDETATNKTEGQALSVS